MKVFYVYILSSRRNGAIYVGVTSNLVKRVWQHKEGFADGFTEKYNIKRLVYYEQHDSAYGAISREKVLKKWKRRWKVELIEKSNSSWQDLYLTII